MINALYFDLIECDYRKSSIEIYKLTKVPSIFNKESIGGNLDILVLVSLVYNQCSFNGLSIFLTRLQ